MDVLNQHLLPFRLFKIETAFLSFLSKNQSPIYAYQAKKFLKVLDRNNNINSIFINNFERAYGSDAFLLKEDHALFIYELQQEIIKSSRSISLGDLFDNCLKNAKLLSYHLKLLYENPFDQKLLKFQFQHIKNLANFLYDNPKVHKPIYTTIKKSDLHFIYKHPLLSSLLLLSYIKSHHIFNRQETITLFIVSYLKDLGMGLIPEEAHNHNKLNPFEKKVLSKHAKNSQLLLKNIIPLKQNYLDIIAHHHFLNKKIQEYIDHQTYETEDMTLRGAESVLVTAIDTFVALTCDRPYRQSIPVFEAMSILKHVLSEDYYQEYKDLLLFINKF